MKLSHLMKVKVCEKLFERNNLFALSLDILNGQNVFCFFFEFESFWGENSTSGSIVRLTLTYSMPFRLPTCQIGKGLVYRHIFLPRSPNQSFRRIRVPSARMRGA